MQGQIVKIISDLHYVKSDNNIVILLTCSKKIKDKQVYFIGQKVV